MRYIFPASTAFLVLLSHKRHIVSRWLQEGEHPEILGRGGVTSKEDTTNERNRGQTKVTDQMGERRRGRVTNSIVRGVEVKPQQSSPKTARKKDNLTSHLERKIIISLKGPAIWAETTEEGLEKKEQQSDVKKIKF